MARKKKPTRKYTPRHEFRYCRANKAVHNKKAHPHYIFGEKDGYYYSLGLTTSPHDKFPFYYLSRSPNPNCKKPQAVQRKQFHEKAGLYDKKTLKGWAFNPFDMSIIRRIIKENK